MVVDPDTGEVDEPLWSALAAIANTKEAYDGTPIKGVRLIVPTRADAIRLAERAKADGIELVTYPPRETRSGGSNGRTVGSATPTPRRIAGPTSYMSGPKHTWRDGAIDSRR